MLQIRFHQTSSDSIRLQDNFIDLVDCLLGPTGGFKLSLDYGANFEAMDMLWFRKNPWFIAELRLLDDVWGWLWISFQDELAALHLPVQGLAHSLSVDADNDGIFVPPIPHDLWQREIDSMSQKWWQAINTFRANLISFVATKELMEGLPECHNFWPKWSSIENGKKRNSEGFLSKRKFIKKK